MNIREQAINAADVLNDLVGDCVAGVMVWRDYHSQHRRGIATLPQMAAVQKMCMSHLVLALSKYSEFYERFKAIIPAQHLDDCRALYKRIESQGVERFRNKIVGHIWDKDAGRPLALSEIMSQLERLIGGHPEDFLRWINDPEGNVYPHTVTSVVETVRNAIMVQHALRPEDFLNR